MPTYRYTVQDQYGNTRTGTAEAEDADFLAYRLQEQGFHLDYIETIDDLDSDLRQLSDVRVPPLDVLVFWIMFSIMIDARVSRWRALDVAAEQAAAPGFASILYSVANQVIGGTPLYKSLSRYPAVFDAAMIGIIRAGEVGNALSDAVHRLIQFLERHQEPTESSEI